MTRKLLLVGLMLVACKKGGDDKKAAAGGGAVAQGDADAVNAAVPADLKGKIEFEAGEIKDDFGHRKTSYKLVIPKGWKKGFMPASLEPGDADNFGSATWGNTKMQLGSNCDGDCQPKDWAAVSDKVDFSQYTSGKVTGKVEKDVKGKNERTLVFHEQPEVQQNAGTASMTVNGQTTTTTVTATSGSEKIHIIHAWWNDGDSRYYTCRAELAKPAMGLEAAFEKVCGKVVVSGD